MAKLYFYYSAMNAGKTTTLLQSSYNYRERGMNTLMFTPNFDTRSGDGKITSRIGLQSDAVKFSSEFNFVTYCKTSLATVPSLKCVLVDEAQFLTRQQVNQLCDVVDLLKLPVLSYGLRSDFLGEVFEGSKYLLAWADEVIEIKTVCHCGSKATMNARIDANGVMVKEGAQIEIGGNDRYISLCRKHFNQAQAQPEHHCVISLAS